MTGGRPKKFSSPNKLRAAVEAYFRSISFDVALTDKSNQPVKNVDGEQIHVTRFAEPPSKSALCRFLGIDRKTWYNYADPALHPELADVVEEANSRIEAYLERELLTRERGLQGVIFKLQNHYGWQAKSEAESGAAAEGCEIPLSQREELLREIAAEFNNSSSCNAQRADDETG